MSTFKSSVSALVLVASLSVTFATHVRAEDSPTGGGPAGIEAIRDYGKKQAEDFQRHDKEWHPTGNEPTRLGGGCRRHLTTFDFASRPPFLR
jgi:hypothetical protein